MRKILKKNLKKAVIWFMAMLLVTVLAGCGGDNTSSIPTGDTGSKATNTDTDTEYMPELPKVNFSNGSADTDESVPQNSSTVTGSSDEDDTKEDNDKVDSSSNNSSDSDDIEIIKKKIITWGDSITVGMAMRNEDRYPSLLQNLLGSNYEVFNAGSSGEKSYTIAARQGAITVYTGKEIVFAKGEATVTIGNEDNNGIVLSDGTSLNLSTEAFQFSALPVNEVYIDGVTYTFNKRSGEFTLTRTDTSKELVIEKSKKVEFSSAKNQPGSYCEIFYVGANDIKPWITPTKAQIDGLIDCYKNMIKRHGNDCYLVVIPHWTSAYDAAFVAAFGDKAVNFRTAAASSGSGKVPQSLLFSTDAYEVHLNADGYKLLAELLHERGQELNYWE